MFFLRFYEIKWWTEVQDLSLSFLRGHLSILNIKENLLLYAEYDRVLRFPGAVEVLEAAHSSTRSG